MTKGTAVLRQQNEKRVLAFLRKERISSRLDIARKLTISKNTVSLIVEKFIKQQIIQEVGTNEATAAGRPKIKITIIPNALKSIGILIQHNQAYLVVTDYYSQIIESERFTLNTAEPEQCLKEIGQRAAELMRIHPETIGVGVGLPGIVDPVTGFVYYSSHLGWSNVDANSILSSHISLPLRVMNSVKASALATLQQLDEETAPSTFYIRIDEGVGGAFLISDKLYFGGTWTAGEVGHLMIDPAGPLCQCGRRGCLEAFIRTKTVDLRLQQEEQETVYRDIGQYLSTALTHIIHLCNPKQIVIDSPYGENALFKQVTIETTQANTLRFPAQHTDILFVRNQENPAVGAALSVIQEYEAE